MFQRTLLKTYQLVSDKKGVNNQKKSLIYGRGLGMNLVSSLGGASIDRHLYKGSQKLNRANFVELSAWGERTRPCVYHSGCTIL